MALVSRVDTVFVPAPDPARAAAWYRRLFSLETIFEETDYVALRFPGPGPRGATALTLVRAAEIDRSSHAAFNFFAPDPALLHTTLSAEAIEITPIAHAGAMTYFDFRDISGNWVNVCHFEERI
jgi:catechol 2,3-dioxygenase-like lactoylglutathione lyase family enzyme